MNKLFSIGSMLIAFPLSFLRRQESQNDLLDYGFRHDGKLFKMDLRLFVVVLLLFANATNNYAQNKFCGSITNNNNGAETAVEFAVVKCLNNNAAVLTNTKGEFCFDDLPTGNLQFEIRCLGYNKKVETVTIPPTQNAKFEIEQGTFEANEVIISATRAGEKQAATFQILNKKEIEKLNVGQDMPYIFQYTPSVVTTSDAGAGVGYTSLRIRGTDGTRINTTVNGVPVNDTESQGTYWVDFPDLVSSAQSIQIQRGVGTSSNGSGAFGASINIQTLTMRDSAHAQSNSTIGSFNTLKNTVLFGTGLLNNHFTMNGRLSRIASDGFIDRASSNMRSIYLDASYFGKKFSLHYVNFSGTEKTYQAWNGVPQAKANGVDSHLVNHYYNNLGYLYNTPQDSINLFGSKNNTYNYFLYKNQTDNYNQYNHQLHFTYNVSRNLFVNVTAHLTKGAGYYEEFKLDEKLSNYGIAPVIVNLDTINKSTLIRRKWLDNNFYGGTYSINYKNGRWQSILGGASNQYFCKHYTNIIWAEYAATSNNLSNYNFNTSLKNDHSVYWKNGFTLDETFSLYTDLQYRYVDYKFEGFDAYGQAATQFVKYNFINPKVGVNARINNKSSVYASYSIANREPTRDDFVASTPINRPTSEQLQDLEIGYKLKNNKFIFEAVYYLMNYKNQMVLTGKLNDVGNPLRTNVSASYRSGIELSGEYKITNSLKLFGNTTISQNKIANYDELVYEYFSYTDSVATHTNNYKNTDIAFSPKLIAVGGATWQINKYFALFYAQKYIGSQYLDNTQNANRSLKEFIIGDAKIMFTSHPKFCSKLNVMLTVNNIFSKNYSSNGYTYSSLYEGKLTTENFVYPQAGRNFMVTVVLGF